MKSLAFGFVFFSMTIMPVTLEVKYWISHAFLTLGVFLFLLEDSRVKP